MGVDSEGNIVLVSQKQRYRLQTQKAGMVYLVIQFREVPSEPYQPPNGGQPTRILEAYRIEERDKLPAEPHLELARIDVDPAKGKIEDARLAATPAKNEIDLRFRQEMVAPVVEAQPVTTVIKEVPIRETPSQPVETITWGHTALGTASKDLHVTGLKNLARELGRQGNLAANLEENIPLDKDLKRYTLVYLTGRGQFELAAEQQASLNRFLQSGGVIFGEGCTDGEGQTRGAREFGLAFNQLANQLKRKLEIVRRGHPLLSVLYVFSDVPQGAEPGMLLEGGRIIYSGSDYGCAWQGGHQDQPLSRDIIRSSFEMGVNMAVYARMMKATGR
jgi:hypothetical protein